jgi:hypothetical protein
MPVSAPGRFETRKKQAIPRFAGPGIKSKQDKKGASKEGKSYNKDYDTSI